MRLRLEARVSSATPEPVGRFLVERFGERAVSRAGDEWTVRAEVEAVGAREANRTLLTELRRIERKTRLRAEWTSRGRVERFFDYVPKGTREAGRGGE